MDRSRLELSADTRLLAQRLLSVGEGETITYADLGATIARPVDGSSAALRSARRDIQRDHMIVFDTITTVGLKRLGDRDIVAASDRTTKGVRRAAERGVAQLACVRDFSRLPTADQLRHTAHAATLCAIAQMTSQKALAAVAEKVTPSPRELPIAETLSMFLAGHSPTKEATP